MNIQTLKKECDCQAELFLAKKYLTETPVLSWNRVCDLQDEISYVVEFDGIEYDSDIILKNEKKANWIVPFNLKKQKIYAWRVKAFDGYEYSDYSPYQYLQYVDIDTKSLESTIDVTINNRKQGNEFLNSEINISKTVFQSWLKARVNVEHVKKFLPSEINVSLSPQMFLSSSIEVKKRNFDFLSSEIYIRTKNLLPPKGPLGVDMQSEFDYITGNQSPTFSWWKSLDELFSNEIIYEIQISSEMSFMNAIEFSATNIKNPISDQMVYPLPIKLKTGTYYWRVRASDSINNSEWVYGSQFTIDKTTEGIDAEIYVVDIFDRSQIVSSINVKPKELIGAEILVWGKDNNFLPAITTVWSKTIKRLNAEIGVYIGRAEINVFSEIYVNYKYSEEQSLKSRIQVNSVPYLMSCLEVFNNQISSEIEVLKEKIRFAEIAVYPTEVKAIQEGEIEIIPSEVNQIQESELDVLKDNLIFSEIMVYTSREENCIFSELEIYPKSFSGVESEILVAKPGGHLLICNMYIFNQHTEARIFAEINILKTKRKK